METTIPLRQSSATGITLNKALLACGLISSLYYVAITVFVAFFYPGYDHMIYTISELSAIGSPTRQLWMWISPLYLIFFAAFGWGVLRVAGDNRPLRIAGILIIIYSLINIYWPPMHMRGEPTSISDTLHLVWGGTASLGMMLTMGFTAAAYRGSFRVYSIVTIVLLLLFGTLMSLEAPNIPVNGPTPLIGFWERIMLGVFLLWVALFSLKLRGKESK